MRDVGYWGLYEYPHEAFAAGARVVLRVWEQDVPEPMEIEFPGTLLGDVRADLEPYFKAMAEGARQP